MGSEFSRRDGESWEVEKLYMIKNWKVAEEVEVEDIFGNLSGHDFKKKINART